MKRAIAALLIAGKFGVAQAEGFVAALSDVEAARLGMVADDPIILAIAVLFYGTLLLGLLMFAAVKAVEKARQWRQPAPAAVAP